MPLANTDVEKVLKKKKLADKYYDNYLEYHHKGEYSKASEYLWGAINALSYALGLFYGKKLGEYSKVREFLSMLSDITAEEIKAAERIHANFFIIL